MRPQDRRLIQQFFDRNSWAAWVYRRKEVTASDIRAMEWFTRTKYFARMWANREGQALLRVLFSYLGGGDHHQRRLR